LLSDFRFFHTIFLTTTLQRIFIIQGAHSNTIINVKIEILLSMPAENHSAIATDVRKKALFQEFQMD